MNGKTIYFGNVFNKSSKTEYISKISFPSYDKSYPCSYEVYINPLDGNLNTNNYIKVSNEETQNVSGLSFKTIYLQYPIALTGTQFAIAIKYTGDALPTFVEERNSNYTYISLNLNNNWGKPGNNYTADGKTYCIDTPIICYTSNESIINLENISPSNYFSIGSNKTLSIPITTEGIPDNSALSVNIRNRTTDLTNNFTINGIIVNNNSTLLNIKIPNNTSIGTYIIDINYPNAITQSKAFTIAQYVKEYDVPIVISDKVTSSTYVIDEENAIISKINSNTSLLEFTENINTDMEYQILNTKGNVISDLSSLGTGYQLKMENNKIYTIAVLGDLNGDAAINIVDIARLQKILISLMQPTYLINLAANVKDDMNINLLDLAKLQKIATN